MLFDENQTQKRKYIKKNQNGKKIKAMENEHKSAWIQNANQMDNTRPQ